MLKNNKKSDRKGFTLVEMGLVLGALAIFVLTIFVIYRFFIQPGSYADNKMRMFQATIGSVENAKASNGGAYPTQAVGTLSTSAIASYVGGASNNQIASWTYGCTPAGTAGTLTIGISVADAPGNDAINILTDKVGSQNWTTTYVPATNMLNATLTNQVCG